MTDPATRLMDAEAEAAAARERLSGTLRKLQVRLNPRDLAKQAGISQSLIFRYFATKQALVEKVYQRVYVARWSALVAMSWSLAPAAPAHGARVPAPGVSVSALAARPAVAAASRFCRSSIRASSRSGGRHAVSGVRHCAVMAWRSGRWPPDWP